MVWTSSQKSILPLSLIIIIAITIAVTLLLKNKSHKIKNIPFIIIAVFLLVLEIIKQYLSLPDYSLWNIPLHFCSTFMIWYSIASFFKGKISSIGYIMATLFGFLFLALFYINPGSIIGSSTDNILASYSTFHTFIYHHCIILFTLLAITLKKFNPKYSQIKWVIIIYSIYAAIAILFANLLQVNFTNLIESNIPFMQSLLDNYGIVIYTIVMYLVGLIGLLIGLMISLHITKIKSKKYTTKEKEDKS